MDRIQSSFTTLQLQAGSHERPNFDDYISQMSDDVLAVILSLMPIKDAVTTSILARRWRNLWHNLGLLNFDGDPEKEKFINQVNSVIRSYNKPTLSCFRIRFRVPYAFKRNYQHVIDDCIEFSLNKKVEFLVLDLRFSRFRGYDFQSRAVPGFPLVLPYLKQLILKAVNVTDRVFEAILKNYPRLEMISVHELKHLKLMYNHDVRSVYLSDIDLESFTYKFVGYHINLRLALLPKLKKLNLHLGRMNINNVFVQILSCALSLQSLSLRVGQTEGCLIHDSVPMLPNLKKLKFAVGENRDDDSLVYLASLMNACPNLVSFSIKSRWDSPIISMKKARGATINPHKHLKIFKIKNYKGRKSDFELAAYIIETVVSLKKVTVIVTRPSMYEEAFQYSAEGLIEFTMPKGVELVIV